VRLLERRIYMAKIKKTSKYWCDAVIDNEQLKEKQDEIIDWINTHEKECWTKMDKEVEKMSDSEIVSPLEVAKEMSDNYYGKDNLFGFYTVATRVLEKYEIRRKK
jgi:hydrogenase maturation factor HypF (carbamoyltransferase family)